MDCELYRDRLAAILDGDAGAEETAATTAHLEHCARCRIEMASIDALRHRLATARTLFRQSERA